MLDYVSKACFFSKLSNKHKQHFYHQNECQDFIAIGLGPQSYKFAYQYGTSVELNLITTPRDLPPIHICLLKFFNELNHRLGCLIERVRKSE